MAEKVDRKSDGNDWSQYPRVWASLISNLNYLSGLLALDHSLKQCKTQYPLIALYTDSFPPEGHHALDARNILRKHVDYLMPSTHKDLTSEPRFYETWSKLTLFSLVDFKRVVLLDSDMLVMQNMDELMDLHLDPPELEARGNKIFAASHACVCNPLKKPHYPKDWIPANCAFTSQHSSPDLAQTQAAPCTAGLKMCNSGLVVANPSRHIYDLILQRINEPALVAGYDFPDQSLLSDLFEGRWVSIPYVYNALKTLRRKGVHDEIWRDERVKNIHYILTPKPWDEDLQTTSDETHAWWRKANSSRLREEEAKGVTDGF